MSPLWLFVLLPGFLLYLNNVLPAYWVNKVFPNMPEIHQDLIFLLQVSLFYLVLIAVVCVYVMYLIITTLWKQ